MKAIKNGWAFEPFDNAICHFRHLPISKAKQMAVNRDSVFVVETINWTYGKNRKEVHHNEYFSRNLSAAISLAAKIEIEAQEVAEEVVSIRKATLKEAQEFLKVYDHSINIELPAVSEQMRTA
jgi:hypothetical protein